MKTTYVRTTAKDIENKLNAGGYKKLASLRHAVSRAAGINKKQKIQLRRLGDEYFSAKSVPTKPVAVTRTKGKAATRVVDERASALPPFTVTFTRLAMNKRAAKSTLRFIQEALDADYTLPDLVHSLEMVV